MKKGLDLVSDISLASVGVDTWGCDYALLGETGNLIENPFHYRDTRTDNIQEEVFRHVPAERIYGVTGIQFLPFNSLFQLYAAKRSTPRLLDAATAFATIPDLFNYWLTGRLCSEFTNATTTQMVDARTRRWSTDLLDELALPSRLFQPIVEPGAVIGGIRHEVSASLADTPVVAPACHDTGSAFAAVWTDGHGAFLSSGTWSLLGAEVAAPVISAKARELNFTNEGGVCGTTRLLKNIGGLWLLQACVRRWAEAGQQFSYDDLLTAARDDQHAFRSLFDPDHSGFFHPTDMPSAIAAYCRQTGQAEPSGQPGFTRVDSREPGVQVPRRPRVARGAHRSSLHDDPDRRRRLAQPAAQSVHGRRDGPDRARRPGRSDRARQHRDADARHRHGQLARRSAPRSSNDRSRSNGSSRSRAIAGTSITGGFNST